MKHGNKFKLALAAVACLSVFSFAAIPEIRITATSEPTASNPPNCWMMCAQIMNYVRITNFALTDPNNSKNNLTLSGLDSIRIRGNSTASAEKKPYRIKFDKEQALFGRPKANSWVLLANYYDATFSLNAIAFRLGEKLGLEFTPSSQHVNLYINNSYKGIYQLTEQIQAKTHRVNVDKDKGFLVEFDYHDAASDEIKFTAAQYSLGTFIKSPEVEGCDASPVQNCNINNTKVKWVQDSINALMNKMAESGFPTNGYRNMIDLESFAKYVLIEQFMDNFDFNSKVQTGALPGSNYAYKKMQGEKMKAGPLWDFDLSTGITSGGAGMFSARYSTYQEPIRPKHTFYQRLWNDPEFIGHFKAIWAAHKSDFTAIPAYIDEIANQLSGSVANNRCANQTSLMTTTTLTTTMYSQEIQKLKSWWNSRITFFDTEVNKLTGSISSSSGGGGTSSSSYTLAVARNPSGGGNVSVTIGNGSAQTNPSGQLSATANTSVTITATPNSGYTFQNWTAVSGSLPSNINADNASITFNINSNVNIRANFQQQQGSSSSGGGSSNYTLQVSRQTITRGDVSVKIGNGTAQSNPANSISVASGASVTITATPNSGVRFVNWTAAAGTSLPSGINASSSSITFTMNSNVNITANFLRDGTTTYTLTINGNEAQGSVSVNGQSYTFGQAQTIAAGDVTLAATAKSGYSFLNWSGTALPSGTDQTSPTITFTISGNMSLTANFRDYTGGAKTDTLVTVEAEDKTSSNPQTVNTCPASPPDNQTMCISQPNSDGTVAIGYINSGNTATYEVNMASGGSYKLAFRIASNLQASFRVNVNGTNMGTISGNTNDWDGYTWYALDQDVYLDAGPNTIRLEFQSAVNVDKFVIIGEAPTTPAKYSVPKAAAFTPAVTLRANRGGFTAMLPANHGYTTYRLIDVRGREVRSGRIDANTADLRFNDLKRGVLLLKLEGKGTPLVLKAVAH